MVDDKFDMPELPDNQRWHFARYGNGTELRLETKTMLFFWRITARAHLYYGISPEDAVNNAIEECLRGHDWVKQVNLMANTTNYEHYVFNNEIMRRAK